MMLMDDDGETYLPNGDTFSPVLDSGKVYTIHGTLVNQSIHAVVPAPEGRIAQANNFQQIALMPQKKRDQTINNIISACRGMNDNLSMLYSGTRTVCLMESLSVLASCGTDVPLVTEQMPANKFHRLKNPHSFRASIYQLIAAISDAFRVSNTCMGTIRAALSDIPNNFSDIIEMLAAQNESDLETIQDTFTSITTSADKCIQMAAQAEKPLDHVLQIIDELCHASAGAKGVNEKTKLELQKLMEQMAIAKKAKEEETKRVEQDRVESMRKVEQARNEYWNQLKKDAPPPKVVKSSFFSGLIEIERVDDSALRAYQQKTVQFKDEFEREHRYEEDLKRSLEQHHRELTDFMCKLKNMDTTSADLASIVSLLQEGIALLSRIRSEWMMLYNFFEKVKIVLNEYLLKSITNFKKFAQKEKVEYMLREALKTVCLCVQISNAADVYTMIMDRQVIPELSKVGKELALTEHEAKVVLQCITKFIDFPSLRAF
uniref:Uncharacterized protein n=1 Tax=Acrobeloides nanus TaxID=290746 RepID=A0A914E7G4_9BILA